MSVDFRNMGTRSTISNTKKKGRKLFMCDGALNANDKNKSHITDPEIKQNE